MQDLQDNAVLTRCRRKIREHDGFGVPVQLNLNK